MIKEEGIKKEKEKISGSNNIYKIENGKIQNRFEQCGINIATKKSKIVFDYTKYNSILKNSIIQNNRTYKIIYEAYEMVYIGKSGDWWNVIWENIRENNKNTSSFYAQHFIKMCIKHNNMNLESLNNTNF